MADLTDKVKQAARETGFEVVGITTVDPLTRDDRAYREWSDAGFAAEMDYMTRRPELPAHPKLLASWASSLITVAINYFNNGPPFRHENRYGRVARYAWGRDYHDIVKPRLQLLAREIEKLAGRSLRSRCFVDAVPLLERAAAARAGIGFFGKNTNLLLPQRGSWFFLAEILIDLELTPNHVKSRISCGTCNRCIDTCPTGAFEGPYKLDSRRCISYLTIENKGPIPRELRTAMGEWVFGCDECQEMRPGATRAGPLGPVVRGQSELVCPFNSFAQDTSWPELRPNAGAGPRLDLSEVLSVATDEEFRSRFKGTPLTRPKRRGLLRNAAVVARNIVSASAVPALVERITRDPDPIIRSHSLWALAGLDAAKARPLIAKATGDPHPQVREEAALLIM